MSDTRTFTARWLFPVSSPPLERGTITVRGTVIEAVEPHGTRTPDEDLGNVALIPGLVNAHTHLDLSGARGLTPPTTPDTFTDWLRAVIAYRRTRTAEQVQTDITNGLAECLKFGTTLIGDIASEGASWDVLSAAPSRAVVFREMLGLSEERTKLAIDSAKTWTENHHCTLTCKPGFSPHAPYSASLRLLIEAGHLCRVTKSPSGGKAPIAIHLAESQAEHDLLYHRKGPFVEFLKSLGVWAPDGLCEDYKYVMTSCDFHQSKLFIHANYLPPNARIPRNSTIVYCPRTHAAFGHRPHPFQKFLDRGVRVCLGTDSLASNPDLDLLAEARFVHQLHPDFPTDQLLRMVTLAGAEALGWADEVGSLEPGKSADFVTVPLANGGSKDPHQLVFASTEAERRTMFRGAWR